MAMLLYSLKDHFKHFVIVGHPTTLRYCVRVFGKEEYRRKISYVRKLDLNKYYNATIISDAPDNNSDLWVNLDYYNQEEREKACRYNFYITSFLLNEDQKGFSKYTVCPYDDRMKMLDDIAVIHMIHYRP